MFRIGKRILNLVIILLASQWLYAQQVTFMDCQARLDDNSFELESSRISRTWKIQEGLLLPESLTDLATGVTWVSESTVSEGFSELDTNRTVTMRCKTGQNRATEQDSLFVDIISKGSKATLTYHFQIFPDTPAIVGGVSLENRGNADISMTSVLEQFKLTDTNLKLTAVSLRDRTDGYPDPLSKEKVFDLGDSQPLTLAGNIFIVENESKQGLMLVKHGPLPWSRPVKSVCDLSYDNKTMRFHETALSNDRPQSYYYAILTYSQGRPGRIAQLQQYQRQLRQYNPKRDGMLLSNTWGDRNRDSRINESFIGKEIEAGAKLGVDIVQIDDGWQTGHSQNSAVKRGKWEDFWDSDFDFWQPDTKRFPNGLKPLIEKARQHNMYFGLWYAIDSSDDFVNWTKDAQRVLKLHRDLGVNYFKFDAIDMKNVTAERNCLNLLQKVTEDSEAVVTVDLDVTAGRRPGYLGDSRVGPIFVENRYTDHKTYYPHRTLRNLWCLAQYIDPVRLRMEFLNNERKKEKYGNDPLAPATYEPDYLFAAVMFASPLAWMEVSELSDAYRQSVTPLVQLWKQHRQAIYSGSIIPVGAQPDGTTWTGFVSVNAERNGGYTLIFREKNDQNSFSFELPLLNNIKIAKTLYGSGTATVKNDTLTVNIPKAQDFVLLQLESR